MRFALIDKVIEVSTDESGRVVRAVAVKHVTAAEEYLADHFPGFPILPGVFMLEALVHTARHVAEARESRDAGGGGAGGGSAGGGGPWVLGSARAVKYGAMVPPGSTLRLEVELVGERDGCLEFKGTGRLIDMGRNGKASGSENGEEEDVRTAVSGRFGLRRVVME